MSENRIETAADEADSPSEETQEEVCEALSEGAGEVVDSEGVEEAEGEDELADSENVVEEETEEAEKYETVEIEYSEDDIEAYIVDEDDNEIGFILLDEDGNEIEYYYDDDEEAWVIRTRNLTSYAISDKKLKTVDQMDDSSSSSKPNKPNKPSKPGDKYNPDTGR